MVARVSLHNMRQDRNEPVCAFGARLRGQASVCKFTQQCPNCEASVDYTEAMVKDVLCRGLGDKNQDMTLEQVLRFVEAKEAGRRSASRLLLPQATDAVAGSSYRKQKKTPPKDQETCTYCGTKGHGRNPPTRVRRKECLAFGTKCTYCNKDHHFEKMCRGKHGAKPAKSTEHEDAISDALCHADHINRSRQHQKSQCGPPRFRQVHKGMVKETFQIPTIRQATGEIRQEDYDHFGFPFRVPQARSFVSAMADTGCQRCLAGLKVVKKLGVSVRDLIPVNIKMQAANNDNIRILGAAILRLLGKSNEGEERFTRQMVYITDNTDKLFLSRKACVDLGIIPNTFPTIGEAEETESANSIGTTDVSLLQQECQCPNGQSHLQSPPPYHSQPQKPTGGNSSNTSWITMPPAHSTPVNIRHCH